MGVNMGRFAAVFLVLAAVVPLHAAVSRQQAEAFARKVAQIQEQAARESAAARRTPVTQDEVNSWFMYSAHPVLPAGVSGPQLRMVGQGRVGGEVTVDLEQVAKRRGSGGTFDPWSYLGGRVPVVVEGILHTEAGRGRFELQSAEVSGVPVPKTILQEALTYYSRTPEDPDGINLDAPFQLPAGIDKIEVGQGQAVVVQ
jgi:hypothetical protein